MEVGCLTVKNILILINLKVAYASKTYSSELIGFKKPNDCQSTKNKLTRMSNERRRNKKVPFVSRPYYILLGQNI